MSRLRDGVTYQEVEAVDDGLTDELLADVPDPDLPFSFPLLELSLGD
jgi:hypothetical protein